MCIFCSRKKPEQQKKNAGTILHIPSRNIPSDPENGKICPGTTRNAAMNFIKSIAPYCFFSNPFFPFPQSETSGYPFGRSPISTPAPSIFGLMYFSHTAFAYAAYKSRSIASPNIV